MTQKWRNSGYAAPDADTVATDAVLDVKDGVDSAVTHYYGTTDPSSGASWGADQMGILWYDSNNVMSAGGDDLGLVVKRWEKLTTDPTYGWRTLYVRIFVPLAANTNKLNLADQGDVGFTDCDLTLDTSTRAVAALLMVTVEDSAPGAAYYAAFRKNGVTTDAQTVRVYPQVAGIYNSAMIAVELDSGQIFEYSIEASGADTFNLRVDVIGYWERA
jgi:hypothetical protein